MKKKDDIVIAGSGCAALYCALNLPQDLHITIITKATVEESDSFLAQGGMCMLKADDDYEAYFEDTLKAGHYENDKKSVEIMIRSSRAVVDDLVSYGVDFARNEDGSLCYTREGAHSQNRIVYHEDITGKEITSKLYEKVKQMSNVDIYENTMLLDIIEKDNRACGMIYKDASGVKSIYAKMVVLATGGIGGLYRHSTNFRQLTGDSLAISIKHGVKLKDVSYVQIHPTTLYSERNEDRSFLISESVRGEGAKLYDKDGNRFVNELLPRDLLTQEIYKQMKKDGTKYVLEDLRTIPEDVLKEHFPNIVKHCMEAGYDVTKVCIPVVPAQHYFMGGIWVDYDSKTSMESLYAIGETACNGVHGKNRLASNSLLESLVFAKRAAAHMVTEINEENASNGYFVNDEDIENIDREIDFCLYEDAEKIENEYKNLVWDEINKSASEITKDEKYA